MNDKPKRKQAAVNLPEDLAERLDRLGQKLDRSRRWQVIQAIKKWLAEQGA